MTSAIHQIEADIIDDFELFDDWMDKYAYIIELGKNMPNLDERFKTETNIVHGCQSQVWLRAFEKSGRIYYEADSDAFITKGLIGLLIKVLSGHTAQEICSARLDFIDRIGIRQHLSTNRANGLSAMIEKMKTYAKTVSQTDPYLNN